MEDTKASTSEGIIDTAIAVGKHVGLINEDPKKSPPLIMTGYGVMGSYCKHSPPAPPNELSIAGKIYTLAHKKCKGRDLWVMTYWSWSWNMPRSFVNMNVAYFKEYPDHLIHDHVFVSKEYGVDPVLPTDSSHVKGFNRCEKCRELFNYFDEIGNIMTTYHTLKRDFHEILRWRMFQSLLHKRDSDGPRFMLEYYTDKKYFKILQKNSK